jgi:hypothetical protein
LEQAAVSADGRVRRVFPWALYDNGRGGGSVWRYHNTTFDTSFNYIVQCNPRVLAILSISVQRESIFDVDMDSLRQKVYAPRLVRFEQLCPPNSLQPPYIPPRNAPRSMLALISPPSSAEYLRNPQWQATRPPRCPQLIWRGRRMSRVKRFVLPLRRRAWAFELGVRDEMKS